MSEPESSAAIRRVVLLVVALAAVIGGILWFQRKTGSTTEAIPSSSVDPAKSWEADVLRSAAEAPRTPSKPPRVKQTLRDKARRDEVRDLIYRAYGFSPPKPGEKAPKGQSPHAPLGRDAGTISPEYIRDRVREDFFPLARECYEAALEREPELAGKLVLSFVIVGDDEVGGVVDSAELAEGSTLKDEELVTCMLESMLSVSFVAPSAGGSVSVTYPFELSPGDGG
jgi:hypothetical protein